MQLTPSDKVQIQSIFKFAQEKNLRLCDQVLAALTAGEETVPLIVTLLYRRVVPSRSIRCYPPQQFDAELALELIQRTEQ